MDVAHCCIQCILHIQCIVLHIMYIRCMHSCSLMVNLSFQSSGVLDLDGIDHIAHANHS